MMDGSYLANLRDIAPAILLATVAQMFYDHMGPSSFWNRFLVWLLVLNAVHLLTGKAQLWGY